MAYNDSRLLTRALPWQAAAESGAVAAYTAGVYSIATRLPNFRYNRSRT